VGASRSSLSLRRPPFCWFLALGATPRSSSCAGSTGVVDDSVRALARVQLARHVDATRLSAWRDSAGPGEKDALDFLMAWLSSSDLAAWRAGQLIPDLRLALSTRRDAPWHDQIDEATFLTYVLPPRSAQEPIQPWRQRLHDLLWDRVKDKTLHEAALEVNRFCREHATFIPPPRAPGSPPTMDRGVGRCERRRFLLRGGAQRGFRPACLHHGGPPPTTTMPGSKCFTGDGWHYLGACEPADDLDQAWFTGPARRAGLVLSVAYGEARDPNERGLRAKKRVRP